MQDKTKCKYLGNDFQECWLVSGNLFQKCMSKNKNRCILLKNKQLHTKIDFLESQLEDARKIINKLEHK